MAKNKRKAKAFATRGKRTQLPSGLDDHNSYVLALRAPDSSLLASSSTSSSLHPPSVHTEGPASLSPIPEDVSCNLEIPLPDLEVVTVEDCSDDEPLADALLADEQLDLDFSDDDGGDMPSHVPSPSVSVPPSSSAACLPLSPKASQGYPSSSITVADATPISYSGTPSGLASPSSPRSRSFSPPRVTQGCLPPAIPYATPSPVTSPFDVWNLCAVGYISGKNPGFKALNGICSSVWKCDVTLTIHDSGWLICRFSREEDKIFVLNGGPYMVAGQPLVLKAMPCFFFIFLMKRCLKSRFGFAFQTSLYVVGLPPVCPRSLVFWANLFKVIMLPPCSHCNESLPKFYNFCNVIGHTRSLCSQALSANDTEVLVEPTLPIHPGKGSVFDRLGPQLEVQPIPAPSVEPAHPVQLNALSSSDTYTDWIAMEPRRKAKKHNRPNPKGKEVISDDMETYVAPSNCAGMTGPPRAKDPPTSTVVTRPSSTTRPTPTLLINPHDGPPNLVTVTDNRRAPPPHSRVS
uniref:DUF4283 domain-containing protein n=1 Tax=Populus alba TaxID=43335 RepID=A0A4V6A9Z8_POPAL|nr:hypothetical protein D5086_0000103270 [Populus alba]